MDQVTPKATARANILWVIFTDCISQGLIEEAELTLSEVESRIYNKRQTLQNAEDSGKYSAKVLYWRDCNQQEKLCTKFGKSRAHWNYSDKLDPVPDSSHL